MKKRSLLVGLVLVCLLIFGTGVALAWKTPTVEPNAILLVTGLQGEAGMGSTIGPDGALYVAEGAAGRISRFDPKTGNITTFASGLPQAIIGIGIGGPMDVEFIDETAYALVTLVGSDIGGTDIVGIYRIDAPDSFTVIADIGAWAIENPPPPITAYDTPTGVQYALESYRGGFLVTDGHHNRVLLVTLDGQITEMMRFDNIVPTGLAVKGKLVYMAEAGPLPHLPENGKVVMFKQNSSTASEIASGAPLLVDVEFGRGRTLYALSQGIFPVDGFPGSPATPDTGALVMVNNDGTFSEIVGGLDRPSSLEFIGKTAYFVSLAGEIWKIDGIKP